MYGRKTEARDKVGNAVMGIGGFRFGEDAYSSMGCGAYRGGEERYGTETTKDE